MDQNQLETHYKDIIGWAQVRSSVLCLLEAKVLGSGSVLRVFNKRGCVGPKWGGWPQTHYYEG
jgi:hypothetical protein